jgi:hypothetical protein
MPSAPNVAVRRFAFYWRVSWMLRVLLVVALLLLVEKAVGGF